MHESRSAQCLILIVYHERGKQSQVERHECFGCWSIWGSFPIHVVSLPTYLHRWRRLRSCNSGFYIQLI